MQISYNFSYSQRIFCYYWSRIVFLIFCHICERLLAKPFPKFETHKFIWT